MISLTEKQKRRKVVVWFAALSVVSYIGYNVFSPALNHGAAVPVSGWWAGPFILLLCSIALGPFLHREWWESKYPFVSFGLGLVVVLYYALTDGGIYRLFLTSYEYVSFISILGSLFIVASGIHIDIRGKAAPWENVMFLGTGAVLANLFGTTGASMVLIRPYVRSNKYRIRGYHIAFFIFLIANVGGALTPVGDPPLFLGYLKGIPFFWIFSRVNNIWALAVVLLLGLFFVIDTYFYRKEPARIQHEAARGDEPRVSGLHNVFFLFVILASVFIEKPLMAREILMWGAALGSLWTTGKEIHDKNEFTFHPIREVAILFAGIFATMVPALDWLSLHAGSIGIVTPGQYFWSSGLLSSVLDNAPTYLNFLTAAFGLHGASVDNAHHMMSMLGLAQPESLGLPNPLKAGALAITAESWKYIQAISVGAVFFGAMTYIGNGPNFMIKSIVEHARVECPTFFGYIIRYSVPVLIPIFALVWYLFFRN